MTEFGFENVPPHQLSLPSWPLPLLPQQYAWPDVVIPHVWYAPAVSAFQTRLPLTATGLIWYVPHHWSQPPLEFPFPSWPDP